MSRNNLVLTFKCSECGSKLDMDDRIDPRMSTGEDNPRLPTGADCLTVGHIVVRPCLTCVGKYKTAAQQIVRGLEALR